MLKMSTSYIKKFRDNILVASLYQLSSVLTSFLAETEVKTEGEKVNQERKAGSKSLVQDLSNYLKTSPILVYEEGWVGHIAPLMVLLSTSLLESCLILTWRVYPVPSLSFQG